MLIVNDLKTCFNVGEETVTAVDGISFQVEPKKVVGLVGESGSGKSVTALSILNLLPNNGNIVNGSVLWKDMDIVSMPKQRLREIRGKEIGLIFQNPLASLNPVFTIGNQMVETIIQHNNVSKKSAKEMAVELLKKVNMPDPEQRFHAYPHQLSLGMCQRVMIAMTLSMKPQLLIADEPTASLDVTIQAQILDLLTQLKTDFNMSVLFISHDLGVVAQYCDEILVMYLGKIVEKGSVRQIFSNPLHPYTQALLSSIPVPDPDQKKTQIILKGDIPSPLHIPKGCRFHPRCPKAFDQCRKQHPELKPKPFDSEHETACFLY
ncbi:ABC transporter ATP-binding protein [Thermoproteota archaeon]